MVEEKLGPDLRHKVAMAQLLLLSEPALSQGYSHHSMYGSIGTVWMILPFLLQTALPAVLMFIP